MEAVLGENETRWESLSEADRERLRVMARAVVQPDAARADAAAEGRRRGRRVPRATCTRCASCSGWRAGAELEGERPRPRSPTSSRAAAARLSAGAAAGHPRQRAGAGAGDAGGRRRSGDGVEMVAITTSGDRGLGAGRTRPASSRRSRTRCCAARWTWRCTRPRTCPASCPTGWRSPACRSARIRATRSAARTRSRRSPRARRWARRACAGARSCWRCGPTSTCARCRGNVDTRLRQAGGRASTTRSVLAAAGLARLGRVRGRADPRSAR